MTIYSGETQEDTDFREFLENTGMTRETADVIEKLRLAYRAAPDVPVKSWLKSNTLRFNAVMVALALVLSMPEIKALIPGDVMPWVTAVILLGNIYLRFLTVGPVQSPFPVR